MEEDASYPPPSNLTTVFRILYHLAGIIREFPIILYGIVAVKTEEKERKHGSGNMGAVGRNNQQMPSAGCEPRSAAAMARILVFRSRAGCL